MSNLTEHGSARWLTKDEAINQGLIDAGGITLGHWWQGEGDETIVEPVNYNGDQHMITLAGTGMGKGTTAIIPNLLDYAGGVICIDPKGENAIVTAAARCGWSNVQVLDPWRIALDRLRDDCGYDGQDEGYDEFEAAGFNPLDMLDPDGNDLTDDAAKIADALVMDEGGQNSHWSNSAKATLAGFCIHVVTSPKEEGQRHLGRVRDILSLPPKELYALIEDMAANGHPAAKAAANRMMQKSEKEFQAIISTAVTNTDFLDSKGVRESLKESTFDFADLKDDDKPLTVYLVLPADRLATHGRWLRLMISMALSAVARRKGKPKIPALFILDEMAALGQLEAIQQAFGLFRGFGLRLWAIFQDLSQMQNLYRDGWQTFIANSGVVQIFGTGDVLTADYVSRYLGQRTIEQISVATAKRRDGTMWLFVGAEPEYSSMNDRRFGRPLMTPDEVRRLQSHEQIVLMPSTYPMWIGKTPYWDDQRFIEYDEIGAWIMQYTQHPDYPLPDGESWFVLSGQAERDKNAEAIRRRQAHAAEEAAKQREAERAAKASEPKKKRWGLF